MTAQPTYTLPGIKGATIKKTLALPGVKQIKEFLKFFGFESLAAMMSDDGTAQFSVKRFDVALDSKKLSQVLDICLLEGSAGLQLADIEDVRIFDDVIQDFFEQRSQNMKERANSLTNTAS